ncbi:hypothetical protein BT69DRAFT_393593 [Atractiella rhizophila]|nr:hypothetical protein BT69DRAFT_393593 [Atractiella rhizophila]
MHSFFCEISKYYCLKRQLLDGIFFRVLPCCHVSDVWWMFSGARSVGGAVIGIVAHGLLLLLVGEKLGQDYSHGHSRIRSIINETTTRLPTTNRLVSVDS